MSWRRSCVGPWPSKERSCLHLLLEDIAEGYELLALEDGQAVLATLAARSVPLLLTDDHMPSLNGIELAQAVKAVSPTTYVVLLTGDPSAAQAAVGVDDILTKPFRLAGCAGSYAPRSM
jgi:CheY-like chemotaxis protein